MLPVERALFLIALGLDPCLSYTHHEVQVAWRRRMAALHPDIGGDSVMAAAVNAAYVALVREPETFHHVDVSL